MRSNKFDLTLFLLLSLGTIRDTLAAVNEHRTAKFEYYSRSIWLLLFFSVAEMALMMAIVFDPLSFKLWIWAAALLFISFNISSVMVQADSEVILITFGIGFFRKTVVVSDIEKLRLRKNKSFYVLFQHATAQALEITERSGRRTIVGIGETRKMLEFFRSRSRGE